MVLYSNRPQGDLSGNCEVGLEDLAIFCSQWLNIGFCTDSPCADLDVDGLIDLADFHLLSKDWNP
jgi:hypothetical protein